MTTVLNTDLLTPLGAYLRLRREDYTSAQIQRWAAFVGEQVSRWSDAFVYFKHEEEGKGPEFARQFVQAFES